MGCQKLTYHIETPLLKVVYRAEQADKKSVQRFLSVDPKATKYPGLSPYIFVAGNPLIYVDPDGKEIFLAKGLTQGQKLEIVGNLQKLTNDKLVYKTLDDGRTQIKIASLAKSGTESKPSGTNLIRRLNSHDNLVTIGKFSGPGAYEGAETEGKEQNSYNGVGTNSEVGIGGQMKFLVVDPETGKNIPELGSDEITLGHELIHSLKTMDGNATNPGKKGTNYFENRFGENEYEIQNAEELETTGLNGYSKDSYPTENDLRKENGKKERAAYGSGRISQRKNKK